MLLVSYAITETFDAAGDRKVTSCLAGILPLSCRSGKPDVLARKNKKGERNDAMWGRTSRIVGFDTHASFGFYLNSGHSSALRFDATGGGLSSAMRRRMSAKGFRGIAASAFGRRA